MRHGSQYRKDADMMIRNNIKLPEPWKDPPQIEPLYTWYMEAFSDLSTCRQLGFSAGPIPWIAICEYIDREEIEDCEMFTFLIRSMDNEYLKYVKEESEKDTKGNK